MSLVGPLFKSKIIQPLRQGPAWVLHVGVTGRPEIMQGPLTPHPRGTIYEALPFFLERMLQARRVQAIDDFVALISLQFSRRRSAGRGRERRPQP